MTLRQANNHSHSHPQVSCLRGHSTTPATKRAQAFGIIRFRAASCLVLSHAVNLRPDYARRCAYQRARDIVSSHTTLRISNSNSGVIFVFRFVALRGGVEASCPNQYRGARPRRVRTSEQLFERISPRKILPNSAASFASSGPSSPRSISRSASASANATRNILSTASASRTLARHSRFIPRSSANSSSGDGLGNHQPGSHTWGGQVRTPAPSGRARDRARCPAVARFIFRNSSVRAPRRFSGAGE